MQQRYEGRLLPFDQRLDISGVYIIQCPDDVVCRYEILGSQILSALSSFGARFPSLQEQTAAYEFRVEAYPCQSRDFGMLHDMPDYSFPCSLSVSISICLCNPHVGYLSFFSDSNLIIIGYI